MAEPEDLLGKADALMARHRPSRTAAEPYAEIPVLDEVVEILPGGDDLPVLTELVLSAPEKEEQIDALAASIRASLLAGLQPEIDALIEQRLKDSLAPPVERLLNDLRSDLQLIAREILSDAIGTAVEREIERRK
ncbi:MAG: hypothetical protein EPO19_03570 [Betaproteobacteria bacterium]|nr:MAG: hypothetical protein EPO19_03570 [Betaproteobacteria bacterium]